MAIEAIWENEPDEGGKLPSCLYFISIDEPSCDREAWYSVKVSTRAATFTVDLCREHKEQYEENVRRIAARDAHFAEQRALRKGRGRTEGVGGKTIK